MLSGACILKRQRAGEVVFEAAIFDLIWLSLVRRTGDGDLWGQRKNIDECRLVSLERPPDKIKNLLFSDGA